MGIYGIAAMMAPAIGPTVGGIVIEFFTWPFLFLFNIPFATAGLIFSAKYLIPTEKDPTIKFDLIGFLFITSGIGAILFGLGRSSTIDMLFSSGTIALIVGGFILLLLFVKYEKTQEQPLLDRKSTRLNSSHVAISYAVFCLK